MKEDPEDRGYHPTRLYGQWQLQSFSITNGDGHWPVGRRGVKGRGRAMQQQAESKGTCYGCNAVTKLQTSTHAGKQEWAICWMPTSASVETLATSDPV